MGTFSRILPWVFLILQSLLFQTLYANPENLGFVECLIGVNEDSETLGPALELEWRMWPITRRQVKALNWMDSILSETLEVDWCISQTTLRRACGFGYSNKESILVTCPPPSPAHALYCTSFGLFDSLVLLTVARRVTAQRVLWYRTGHKCPGLLWMKEHWLQLVLKERKGRCIEEWWEKVARAKGEKSHGFSTEVRTCWLVLHTWGQRGCKKERGEKGI